MALGAPAVPAFPPIDWAITTTFLGPAGEDVPLRVGRHDSAGGDGFGQRHIVDGHGEVPAYEHIEGALQQPVKPCAPSGTKISCLGDAGNRGMIIVAFTERVDSASGDDRPVGIITAYYVPRGCPC